MKKIKCFIFIFIGFSTATCISQVALIQGQVFGSSDVEGIHVINKTSNKFSTTNTAGFFDVQAKINDTIVFSSVQYKLVSVIVTSKVFREQAMDIFLEEQVNNLPEITVGKILSGDLEYQPFAAHAVDGGDQCDFLDHHLGRGAASWIDQLPCDRTRGDRGVLCGH